MVMHLVMSYVRLFIPSRSQFAILFIGALTVSTAFASDQDCITRIRSYGGQVTKVLPQNGVAGWSVSLAHVRKPPSIWVYDILKIDGLVCELDLSHTAADDSSIDSMVRNPNCERLRQLNITGTLVRGSSFAGLRRLRDLREVIAGDLTSLVPVSAIGSVGHKWQSNKSWRSRRNRKGDLASPT
jgi:hypothetical protein